MKVKELIELLGFVQAEQQRVLHDERPWSQVESKLAQLLEREEMLLDILRRSDQRIAVPEDLKSRLRVLGWKKGQRDDQRAFLEFSERMGPI